MSSGSTGYDSKTYESLKYWYDTQAWLPKNAVIVNKKAFDALDPATQAAVTKAAADAEVRGWKLSEEKNDWYKKALAEKGMKIVAPPAKLVSDMKQVGTIMQADWVKKPALTARPSSPTSTSSRPRRNKAGQQGRPCASSSTNSIWQAAPWAPPSSPSSPC